MDLQENDNISLDKTDSEKNSNNNTNIILHKTDLILLNNGWNDKNERLIISIGENAASYKWMHEKSSNYYKNLSTFLNILLIILAIFLSAETIIPLSYIQDNMTIFISKQVLTYIITILTILQNFFKYDQLVEKHINASLQFNDLYHDIQKQMCMYRRDRINATIYISENLKCYDSLVINNPDIVQYVTQKFKKIFKNSNIALPDIADKIQKIEIITETKNTNNNNNNNNNNINNNIKTLNNTKNDSSSSSSEYCNNLSNIYNAFQIHGDISDKDLQNLNSNDLKDFKNGFNQNKSNYEYQRFLQHSKETD
jgi:hypothetical protein|uniref:SMODS and SLOG-associating 2TM effector domain-containing protein n=1 Tax=viral metagenome TaxID=1070528 RepID=A0A6C0AMX1_9ZZZZ